VCVFNFYLVAFSYLGIIIDLWLFITVLTLHEELQRMCQNFATGFVADFYCQLQ